MMIQLSNKYGDSYIYVNVDAITTLTPALGETGTIISTVGGNTYAVKEDAPSINSMIIAAQRG